MELIFFYVNLSSTKFIEKQGFNFSPNYFFEVDYNNGKYILYQENKEEIIPEGFFDESGCISNITAIVGENGSGKTTLLECLQSGFHLKKAKNKIGLGYHDYEQEKYENNKQIAIYKEDDKLVCYHNIDNFIIDVNIELKCVDFCKNPQELTKILNENIEFRNISKISLTNSMYSKDGLSTHDRIDSISLNPNSLDIIKNSFYKTKIRLNNSLYGGFYEISFMLSKYRTKTEFQQILDVLYLNQINNSKEKSIFDNVLKHDLTISFQRIDLYLEKWLEEKYEISNKNSMDNKDKEKVTLNEYYEIWKKCISKIKKESFKNDIFLVIYSNLLFELIASNRVKQYDDRWNYNNKDELVNYIESVIYELAKNKDSNHQYFLDAFKEIQKYENCLKKCSMTTCLLPNDDLAYVSYKILKHDNKAYNNFMNLIKVSMLQKRHSFVLRYINIGGLKLSSGERALLNFFSWLNITPYFKKINEYIEESLFDNVLLLIDEIDLYCHPSWQQKMIEYLIQEIKIFFKGKKVQIIFTTHSPIILSDIPKSNIIYLRQKNMKCSIDDNINHTETFGTNIYKLFNDAFFLEEQGQVGEFAKRKIQNTINKILSLWNRESEADFIQIKQLEKEVLMIGEPIIRERLFTMLYKSKYYDNDLDLKERRIKMYKEKIKQLEEEML